MLPLLSLPTTTDVTADQTYALYAHNAPAMTLLLEETAFYLGPLATAFSETPYKNAKGKMRYQLVGTGWNRPMADVQKWVKIGGKNGMAPMDVAVLLGSAYYMEAKEQTKKLFGGHRVGFVFDGDNLEPETTPFSVLISDLINADFVVVAVKEDMEVSTGFYDSWIRLAELKPNFLFVSAPGIKKEKLTEAADGFVYYGTTYSGTKDYRFRDDGSSTQGYSEVEALRDHKPSMYFLRDGRKGNPLVVAAKSASY